MDLERIRFRRADVSDAEPIAELHAESWRRHYRGAYSDSFLDGDVARDRRAVWGGRLSDPGPHSCTIVAEDGGALAGFAHTALDEDGTWGALLDNLHVAYTHQRAGIGSKLLVLSAGTVVRQRPRSGLYLWVLEQNRAAQTFYAALGGERVERDVVEPPGGDPSRLNGIPVKLRYAWPDPAALLG
jgi:ribosomal protein S18 acetylase RimI-like enzyme